MQVAEPIVHPGQEEKEQHAREDMLGVQNTP